MWEQLHVQRRPNLKRCLFQTYKSWSRGHAHSRRDLPFREALPSPVLAPAAHRALAHFRRAHAPCDAPDTRASAGSRCRMDFKPQLPNIHALRGACWMCSLGQLPRERGRWRLSPIGWPPAETKNYRGPPGPAAGPRLSRSLGGGRHGDPALVETTGLVPAAGPGAHAQCIRYGKTEAAHCQAQVCALTPLRPLGFCWVHWKLTSQTLWVTASE